MPQGKGAEVEAKWEVEVDSCSAAAESTPHVLGQVPTVGRE